MDAFERHCMAHFEEEERLLHVAITRAREGIYLLTTRHTMREGRLVPARRSFFLKNLLGKGCAEKSFPPDSLEHAAERLRPAN